MELRIGCGPVLAMLVTTIFALLKLTGVIAWSWVWVLSPLWIGLTLALVYMLVASLIQAFDDWQATK